MPHSRSYTRCFVPCFWRSNYQPQSWCRLAVSKLVFSINLSSTHVWCTGPMSSLWLRIEAKNCTSLRWITVIFPLRLKAVSILSKIFCHKPFQLSILETSWGNFRIIPHPSQKIQTVTASALYLAPNFLSFYCLFLY